jgi:uronate dehydrogenase
VLVTGAAGRIGTYLWRGLPERGWRLRLLDVRAIDGAADMVVADVRDERRVEDAMRGVDAVVHLAGHATEAPVDEILTANVEGTWRVFEAARRAGVRRIVYAGSNHAVGFTPRCERLGTDVPLRPDTNYGVSKAFGEILARFYADRHGMEVACLRIGSCDERPLTRRMLATWLSPDDAVRLVDACLRAPSLRYAVVYGVSANTRGWWDLAPGRAIGYEPRDDAELFAAEIRDGHEAADPDDPDEAYAGGAWTTFSAGEEAPRGHDGACEPPRDADEAPRRAATTARRPTRRGR